jgi:hypothetical protein
LQPPSLEYFRPVNEFWTDAAWQFGPAICVVLAWHVLPETWQRRARPWLSFGGTAVFGLLAVLGVIIGVLTLGQGDSAFGVVATGSGLLLACVALLFFRRTAYLRAR